MTKRWIGSALALALIVAAGLAAGLAFRGDGQDAAAQTDDDRRTVSVSGNGQVSVEPDTGYISVGVEVTAETADAALAESNERIDAVTAALVGAGIAEDDITLGFYSIWPEYNYESEQPELRGFRVSHQLAVTVRNVDQTGDVLSTAVEAGANAVHNVTFGVEDPTAALDRARERAFEDAQRKGESLAGLSGGSLGVIVEISENSFTPGPIERYGFDGDEEAAGDAVSSVPINPGESTFSVDVQVVWELE